MPDHPEHAISRPIEVLALDIDGVVTDGTALVAAPGREEKRFAFQDLDAVVQARALGLRVVMVSGEEGPAVDEVAERFGVSVVVPRAKDKAAAIEELSHRLQVPLSQFCYVGDGDRDAAAMRLVGIALAPANATPAAMASAHRILRAHGGAGAIAEAVALLRRLSTHGERSAELTQRVTGIFNESLAGHQRLIEESVPSVLEVANAILTAFLTGRKLLLFGNGGSAADAQHVAAEFVGRFEQESDPWPAIALTTDTSALTAIGNDYAFEEVFARQVRALARSGDVVVGITTSGRSPNVLRGVAAGRDRGAVTIGFMGERDSPLGELCDITFRAPARSTARIQELHLLAWHAVCDIVESELCHADADVPGDQRRPGARSAQPT